MKYKDIIQELKESPDQNITAFLKDVEKKKRLSKTERQVCKHACPFAFHSFDEDDPQLYKGVENEWGISPRPKKAVEIEKNFEFNPYGVRVRCCCASCSHRDISRAVSSRFCTEHHKNVNPHQMCSLWKMSDLLRTLQPGK